MSSAQGFGARKGAKELAREQAALGDMDGVVTPTPVKAPTAPRELPRVWWSAPGE